jgi:hypothetical protein
MWMHMMRAGEEFLKSHMNDRMPIQPVHAAEAVQMVN